MIYIKIQAVVPIKLNNERFPNKNLALLNGKPLCTYLLTTLSKINEIETYVYCSDEAIIPYLPKGIKFYKRAVALDEFSVKRQQIVSSILQDLPSDVYVYAHVTNPFLTEDSIRLAVQAVVREGYDSAIGVTAHQKYAWYQNKPINFDTTNLLRTQDIEPVYIEMGLFVFRHEVAVPNGSVYGKNMKLIPVTEQEAVDIDYKEDLDLANLLIKQKCSQIRE